MADGNPLDALLSTDVDQRAINALVGSLESRLCAPAAKDTITSGNSVASSNSQVIGLSSVITPDTSNINNLSILQSQLMTNKNSSQPVDTNTSSSANSITRVIATNQSPVNSTVSRVPPNDSLVNNAPLNTPPHVVNNGQNSASAAMFNLAANIAAAAEQKNVKTTQSSTSVVSAANSILQQSSIVTPKPAIPVPTNTLPKQESLVKQESAMKQEVKSNNSRTPTPTSQMTVHIVNSTAKNMAFTQPNVVTVNRTHAPQTVSTPMRQTLVTSSGSPNMAINSNQLRLVSMNSPMRGPAGAQLVQQRTLAPRIIQHHQPRIIATQPQMLAPNQIRLPPGFQLPPGAVLVRNDLGQIMMVNPGPNAAIQTTHANALPNVPQHVMQLRSTVPTSNALLAGNAIQQQANLSQVQQVQSVVDDNVKKCKNFLSTLLKLASKQQPETINNVRCLIQGLIDGKIEPEDFTQKLQIELHSSPQPYLVPFLKKSLPLLRQFLAQNKLQIDGVQPPPSSMPPPQVGLARPHPLGQPRVSLQQIVGGQQPISSISNRLPMLPQLQSTASSVQNLVHVKPTKQLHKNKLLPGNSSLTMNAQMGKDGPSASAQRDNKRKYESLKEDDDINDVATMGGVNLTEESRNILATNADFIGQQARSCKDEIFLYPVPLSQRINAMVRKHGLDDIPQEVANMISHATQERLRSIIERLSLISEHRLEVYKHDKKHQVTNDVKSQLRFLEELDKLEKKRHEEQEREVLIRAAKSRSKHEDPEQLKLKQKAKELQQQEMDALRHMEANQTALAAIGPRKKRKMDGTDSLTQQGVGAASTSTPSSTQQGRSSILRPRMKRVNLRDLLFLLEQEKETTKSNTLYSSYLK